ncbi:uncharacterized protein LOC130813542 [Amaranthus tricolor]|uniref:uncharacterized protein LOC130813542 n=1 Tax=Amaranthus tricolor TaxID=29722 RepID=UPI002585010B|nr:uncharacterized protein LOC130813542 [Amaranthus tricolor]
MPTQHRLLVLVFRMRRKIVETKLKRKETIMWSRLKGEKVATLSSKIKTSGYPIISDDANQMWETMAETIRKMAKNTLGVSIGKPRVYKESWWWHEEVQKKVKDKNKKFKELMACTKEEDRIQKKERYKEAKREAQKAVAEAKSVALKPFIKSSISKRERNIFLSWLKLDGLTKESRQTSGIERTQVYGSISDITTAEVRKALKKMGGFKTVGPDNIPIEVWRGLGEEGIHWLTKLFNDILRSSKMPEEWRVSTIIPLFKNKGDAQNEGTIGVLNF